MGLADTVTKAYMKDNSVFADAFNYLIYGGEAVVGKGKTIVDGMEQNVKAGDVITMSAAV